MSHDWYAGFGSRNTPPDVLDLMTQIAIHAHHLGWWLRSGGARGADTAFEQGAGINKRIYRPTDVTSEMLKLAESFHPAWGRCSDHAKNLHARNCPIVLGDNLAHPVKWGCCWTPGARITGGSGQALRIAKVWDIPIYNLANPEHRAIMEQWCNAPQ